MPRRPKAKPSRSHEEATVEGLCAPAERGASGAAALTKLTWKPSRRTGCGLANTRLPLEPR
jgi:hypothetical protein